MSEHMKDESLFNVNHFVCLELLLFSTIVSCLLLALAITLLKNTCLIHWWQKNWCGIRNNQSSVFIRYFGVVIYDSGISILVKERQPRGSQHTLTNYCVSQWRWAPGSQLWAHQLEGEVSSRSTRSLDSNLCRFFFFQSKAENKTKAQQPSFNNINV